VRQSSFAPVGLRGFLRDDHGEGKGDGASGPPPKGGKRSRLSPQLRTSEENPLRAIHDHWAVQNLLGSWGKKEKKRKEGEEGGACKTFWDWSNKAGKALWLFVVSNGREKKKKGDPGPLRLTDFWGPAWLPDTDIDRLKENKKKKEKKRKGVGFYFLIYKMQETVSFNDAGKGKGRRRERTKNT